MDIPSCTTRPKLHFPQHHLHDPQALNQTTLSCPSQKIIKREGSPRCRIFIVTYFDHEGLDLVALSTYLLSSSLASALSPTLVVFQTLSRISVANPAGTLFSSPAVLLSRVEMALFPEVQIVFFCRGSSS
jgi:hypothetical protein